LGTADLRLKFSSEIWSPLPPIMGVCVRIRSRADGDDVDGGGGGDGDIHGTGQHLDK
jgi:hypothetical protein